jgi:hypothetical protein
LKKDLRLAGGAPFAKNTGEEIVPNGWRRHFGADIKHQISWVQIISANRIAPRVEEKFGVWCLRPARVEMLLLERPHRYDSKLQMANFFIMIDQFAVC